MTTPSGRDFFDFVKAIGESKSKQEEDRIIADELVYLKKIIPMQQASNKKKLKELLVRSIYVEMLGQDASFAYIRAVELCASTNIVQKRIGYLTAYLCFAPSHEFRFMLVNQIQRDMKSSNHLEACAALTAVCKLVTEDMIPAVISDILKLITHDMDVVRKRAIVALHRMYQLDKSSLIGHTDSVRRCLCDKDPSVMGASLPLLLALVQDDLSSYKDVVPSLVSILKQITEHRLPKEFDYHRIPAPWLQMHLLRILAILGKGDQASSEGMYEVLVDVIKRADTGINVGYAIVYETVKTITSIYPNPTLLDAAATAISRFVRSDSHNLKYIGIKGLASIVKENPKYAADHQLAVIDCLEDPDETLKRKTLDLLFRMTNSMNVEFIVEKLLSFLQTTSDDHFRTDLVGQITQCAERYAPSNVWYVQTIVRVFELAGDKVKMSVAQTLIQLIAEGAAEEDDNDEENPDDILRMDAVEDFLELIENPKISEILSQTMAWVLGEYGYLSESHSKEEIMNKLCNLAQQTSNPTTRSQVVTALMKLVAQNGSCPSRVNKLINLYSDSISLDLQQRCLEFRALLSNPDTMVDVLPVDASCEDIDVDESLSFLNGFVQQALANGAAPYSPPDLDDGEDDKNKSSGLKITPYERPTAPPTSSGIITALVGTNPVGIAQGPTPLGPAISNPSPVAGAATQGNQLLNTRGVTSVWGKKPPPPPPAPTPSMPNETSSTSVEAGSSSSVPAIPLGSIASGIDPLFKDMQAGGGFQSSPSVSAAVSQTLTPEQPKQLSQKEILAQALFSGVGGSSSTANNAATRAAARAAKRSEKSATSGSQSLTAAVTPVTPQSGSVTVESNTFSAVSLIDVSPISLSNSFVDSVTTPQSVSLPTNTASIPVSSRSNDIMDLLDMNNMDTNPPAPISPHVYATSAQPVVSLSDVFSDLTVQSTPAALSPVVTVVTTQPLQLTTAEFGQRWSSVPFELKHSITSRIRSLEQLRSDLTLSSRFYHVESISQTNEAIFAAQTTLASPGLILVHVKVNTSKSSCDVIIKGANKDVCSMELNQLMTSFTSF